MEKDACDLFGTDEKEYEYSITLIRPLQNNHVNVTPSTVTSVEAHNRTDEIFLNTAHCSTYLLVVFMALLAVDNAVDQTGTAANNIKC